MLAWLMNMGFAGGGTVVPPVTPDAGLRPGGIHHRRDGRRRFLLPDGTIVLARTNDEVTRLIARSVAEAVPEAVERTILRPKLNRKGREAGPAIEPVPQLSAGVLEAISRLQQQAELFAMADAIAIAQAKAVSELRAGDEDALAAIMMMAALV